MSLNSMTSDGVSGQSRSLELFVAAGLWDSRSSLLVREPSLAVPLVFFLLVATGL